MSFTQYLSIFPSASLTIGKPLDFPWFEKRPKTEPWRMTRTVGLLLETSWIFYDISLVDWFPNRRNFTESLLLPFTLNLFELRKTPLPENLLAQILRKEVDQFFGVNFRKGVWYLRGTPSKGCKWRKKIQKDVKIQLGAPTHCWGDTYHHGVQIKDDLLHGLGPGPGCWRDVTATSRPGASSKQHPKPCQLWDHHLESHSSRCCPRLSCRWFDTSLVTLRLLRIFDKMNPTQTDSNLWPYKNRARLFLCARASTCRPLESIWSLQSRRKAESLETWTRCIENLVTRCTHTPHPSGFDGVDFMETWGWMETGTWGA